MAMILFIMGGVNSEGIVGLTFANISLFGWTSLTEAINKITPPKTFILQSLFAPKTKQHLTDNIQISIKVGNKKLAPFVKRSQPGVIIEKSSESAQYVQLPRIRMKKPFTAKELLFEKSAEFPIYVGSGAEISSYREQKIGEELQEMKDRAYRRMEWMACQALSGAISVTQDNVKLDYNFLMPQANKPGLTNNALWSAVTTANPIANIKAWQVVVQNSRGMIPTMAIARHEVISYFLANEQVQKQLNLRNLTIGAIDTNKVANEMGAKYIGSIEGVDIYEYNETYEDANGAVQPMIPADRFIMVSPRAENRLHYGAIEDLDAGQNIALPFFSKDWMEKDPSVYWLLTETDPLPVPHEPETIVYAKVL
jgi:hypothetical protein